MSQLAGCTRQVYGVLNYRGCARTVKGANAKQTEKKDVNQSIAQLLLIFFES